MTNAIDKIIKELSYRDYKAAWNKLTKSQKERYKNGKYHFNYSLGQDTKEAIEIKNEYLKGKINEEQYKAYCLKYNLATR